MDPELIKGTLALLILSLLSRRSMYGYEIAATVHADTDGAFTWREGSLYPNLHKMQADGLIVGEWEEKETGRKRALLPHHQERSDGSRRKDQVVDRFVRGRQPRPGEVRWTSLSTISIKCAGPSAARDRCGSMSGRNCASICSTRRPSTARPA